MVHFMFPLRVPSLLIIHKTIFKISTDIALSHFGFILSDRSISVETENSIRIIIQRENTGHLLLQAHEYFLLFLLEKWWLVGAVLTTHYQSVHLHRHPSKSLDLTKHSHCLLSKWHYKWKTSISHLYVSCIQFAVCRRSLVLHAI